jgi:hypothetical protein
VTRTHWRPPALLESLRTIKWPEEGVSPPQIGVGGGQRERPGCVLWAESQTSSSDYIGSRRLPHLAKGTVSSPPAPRLFLRAKSTEQNYI